MNKVTSFTYFTTPEATFLSATYSVVDEDSGEVTDSNRRETISVFDSDALADIDSIKTYLEGRVNNG